MNIYIGIDPGMSGGLAWVPANGNGNGVAIPMPETERDIIDWLVSLNEDCVEGIDILAYIEQVGGYIGEKQPGSAMFKFGQSYGGLRMALTAVGIPYQLVTPAVWQRALGIPKRYKNKGETKPSFKNRLKAAAQRLFPKVKVTLATADALLIAEFCRRKHMGLL